MKIRTLLAAPAFALILFATAACGDGPAKTAGGGAVGAPVSATAPAIPADFGPAPKLGGNVKTISPAHAAQVKQASTRSPVAATPKGLCADVNFDGLPENGLWFRVAFDGKEVTTKLSWAVDSKENPTNGRLCYAPAEGFPVGKHSAALSVQDPNNPAAPTRQIVGWAFEVTP